MASKNTQKKLDEIKKYIERGKDSKALKLFEKLGPDEKNTGLESDNGKPLSFIAAKAYNAKLLDEFAINGADLSVKDRGNNTILHMVANSSNERTVQDHETLTSFDQGMAEQLYNTIHTIGKHLGTELQAQINAINNVEYTPLSIAAREGNIPAFEAIFAMGADTNKFPDGSAPPLEVITTTSFTPKDTTSKEARHRLIQSYTRDINNRGVNEGTTVLHDRASASQQNGKAFKGFFDDFIDAGFNINHQNEKGETILSNTIAAAAESHTFISYTNEKFNVIFNKCDEEIDLRFQNSSGQNYLHQLAELKSGIHAVDPSKSAPDADVNEILIKNMTERFIKCCEERKVDVKELLSQEDKYGKTPLDYASKKHHLATTRLMKEQGAPNLIQRITEKYDGEDLKNEGEELHIPPKGSRSASRESVRTKANISEEPETNKKLCSTGKITKEESQQTASPKATPSSSTPSNSPTQGV